MKFYNIGGSGRIYTIRLTHRIPKERRSVNADLLSAAEPIDLALGRLTTSFKAPSFNGEGEVELFIKQFEDVSNTNNWSEDLCCITEAVRREQPECIGKVTLLGKFSSLFGLNTELRQASC